MALPHLTAVAPGCLCQRSMFNLVCEQVAQLFCAQWNVMGVDLMNEPYTAHWGDGSRFDWQRGATRMGNAALSGCPRWLIVVQGTSVRAVHIHRT